MKTVHAHNLLIDIGSLTLKKTMKHCRQTLVLFNLMLTLIFVVFVTLFENISVQSHLLYALVFICVAF